MYRFLSQPVRLASTIAAVAGMVLTLGATPARADDIVNPSVLVVTTTGDGVMQNNKCSLREALINANNNDQSGSSDCPAGFAASTDVIKLEGGKVYSLNYVGEDDTANLGDLDILNNAADLDLVLESDNASRAVIKAAFDDSNLDRVLEVVSGASATLRRITVMNGVSSEAGGGIYNDGTLTLEGGYVLKNQSHGDALGGGIYNAPGATLKTSGKTMFAENLSMSIGGAIANFGGSVELNDTTLQENTALNDGGAIANTRVGESPGILYIRQGSTLLKNTAAGNGGSGGAIWNGPGGYLDIRDVELRENRAVRLGGAIFVDDTATVYLANSTLAANVAGFNDAPNAWGGALFNDGSATLDGVVVRDNAVGNGNDSAAGGIWNSDSMVIHHSAIVNNRTGTGEQLGGGIFNAKTLTVWNSTLSGNVASGGGSALSSLFGTNTLVFTTVADNSTTEGAAGAILIDGNTTLTMRASVVGGNTAKGGPQDCLINGAEKAISGGYNILATACTGFTDSVNNDRVGVDPQLQALTAMGTTFAHPLADTSPARDVIPAAACTLAADGVSVIENDQRGELRPQHFACDIGAVERTTSTIFVPLISN